MTVDIAYVRRSIDAALGLAIRDSRAWSGFDLTPEGFFRSFVAVLVVVPLNVVIDLLATNVAIHKRMEQGLPVVGSYESSDAVFSTIALCVQWLIFPIAMIYVLRFLGLAHRYSALIIAHNWATVIVVVLNIPAYALATIGLISPDQAFDLTFIILGLTLYYRLYITQTALESGWSVAGMRY